ncbi:MAG: hypothetical protein IPJ65_17845 [Archangiaceae bacterium]|nr:hypothetical protein [Archangiaceae bacterium]
MSSFNRLLQQFNTSAARGVLTPRLKETISELGKSAVSEADKRALANAVDASGLDAATRARVWQTPELAGASRFRDDANEPKLVTLQPGRRPSNIRHPGTGIMNKVRADDPLPPRPHHFPHGPVVNKIRADDPVPTPGPINKVRADDPVPTPGPIKGNGGGVINKIRADDPVPTTPGPIKGNGGGVINKIRADDPVPTPGPIKGNGGGVINKIRADDPL